MVKRFRSHKMKVENLKCIKLQGQADSLTGNMLLMKM